jgi:hypothetical protein
MIMTTAQRINRIQLLLQKADADLLAKIEAMLEQESAENTSVLTDAQKSELDLRREKHLNGESKSYSWQEIKQALIDQYGLPT